MAASPNVCVPEFVVLEDESFKCCNTSTKNMKLTVRVDDVNDCLNPTSVVCVTDVSVATPNDTIGDVVFPGGGSSVCLTEEGTFTVFLTDVSNCSVNLLVTFTVDGGDAQVVPLKSGNIPQGNETGDCVP